LHLPEISDAGRFGKVQGKDGWSLLWWQDVVGRFFGTTILRDAIPGSCARQHRSDGGVGRGLSLDLAILYRHANVGVTSS